MKFDFSFFNFSLTRGFPYIFFFNFSFDVDLIVKTPQNIQSHSQSPCPVSGGTGNKDLWDRLICLTRTVTLSQRSLLHVPPLEKGNEEECKLIGSHFQAPCCINRRATKPRLTLFPGLALKRLWNNQSCSKLSSKFLSLNLFL